MQNGNRRINLSSAVKFAFAMLLAVAMFFGGMFVLNNKISQKQATVQIDSDTTATVDDNVDADVLISNWVGESYYFNRVDENFTTYGLWTVPKGTASCFKNFNTNSDEGRTSFTINGAYGKWETAWFCVQVPSDYYNGKSIRFTCDYRFSTSPNNGGVRFGLYSSKPSSGDPGNGLASTRMSEISGTAQFTYTMYSSNIYYLALSFGDMPDGKDINVTLSNFASGISVKNMDGESSVLIVDGTMTYGQLAPVKLGYTNSAKIIRGVLVNRLPIATCKFYSYNSGSSSVDTCGYLYKEGKEDAVATADDENAKDSYLQPLISYYNADSSLIFGVGLYGSGTMASWQIWAYARKCEAEIDSTKYSTLEAAIKNASSGSTIEILVSSLDTVSNNISKSLTITSRLSTTITWDRNRQSSASDAMFNISGSATVTFGGSNTIELDGGKLNYQRAINISSTNATCNLSSVTIQNFKNTSLDGGAIYSKGILNLSGTAKIDNNSATNGGGVYVYSGTLNMADGTISNNTATNGGGGVYVYEGTATMTGGTISNNTATNHGGGIFIVSGSRAEMTGGTISNNTATSQGGGIFSYGDLTISGGTISGNKVSGSNGIGGGICSEYNLTIRGGTISGNKAEGSNGSGGGIYFNYSSGTLAISDTAEINGNSATNGAGVYVNSGTMEMTGGTISNNTATNSGGGIYFNSSSSTLTISDKAEINGNSATSGGAGICITSGTMTMTGGTISSNTADYGGGIYKTGTGLLKISNTAKIDRNSSTADGGGIYIDSGTATMTGGTISNNTATKYGGGIFSHGDLTISGGTISGNTAGIGGGICVDSGTATMTGGTISNNTASTDGGGIYSFGDLTISGGTISGNKTKDSNGSGGGIYFEYSSATLAISGKAKIDGNSATNGGGVYVYEGTATMTGGTISNNTASTNGGGIYSNDNLTISGGTISNNTATINGGGIYFDYSSSTLAISGTANIYGNSATNGGGIYIASGTLNMNGGTIGTLAISDTAEIGGNSADFGAGVYVNSGTMEMSGGTISKNTATNSGGGIYSSVNLTISGGTISNNTANSGGGIYFNYSSGTLAISDTAEINENSADSGAGIFINSGTLNMNGGTISNNTATKNGGGINSIGNLTISGGTISNNTASTNGGGIYSKSVLAISGGTISKNTATKNGGGIYFDYSSGTLAISDTAEINENSATYGGGIYIASGTLNMTGGTISNNMANSGGGIYSYDNLTISGGTISNNMANSGGGIYSSGNLTINDGTISSNTAYTNGGGIYSSGNLTINDGTISSNTAYTNGGGIYSSGNLTINDGTISSNTAYTNGGGIYSSGNLTINDGTISSNTAYTNGGGIYSSGNLTINDGTISSNTANFGGGICVDSGTATMTGGTISNNNGDPGSGIYNEGSLTISGGRVTSNYQTDYQTDIFTTKDFTLVGVGDGSNYIDGRVYLGNDTKILRTNNADSVEQWFAAGSKIAIGNAKSGYVVFDYTNSSNTSMVSDYGNVSIDNNGYELAVNGKTLILNATQYTITYALNGGTGVEKSQTYNVETNLTLLGTPTRAGYTFGGWKVTTASGNWKKDATFTASQNVGTGKYGNITLTAQWTPTQYKITYNLNDGTLASGKTNPTSYTIETATFTLNNPAKAGYTFTGWTGSNGTTAQTTVTITKGSTGNRTYTANWTINSYTLTANANGGTIPATTGWTVASGSKTATKSLNYGAQYGTLPTPNPYSKTGYTVKFKGWFTSASGGSPVSATTTMGASNTTIYAQWTETINSYTLTANANGGTIPATTGWTVASGSKTATKSLNYGAQYGTLPTPNPYSKTGYTVKFKGWFTSASGGSPVSATTTMGASNTTIYAQWTETINSYTLTANANGGTIPATTGWTVASGSKTATKSLNYGAQYGTLPTPNPYSKTGYTVKFKGWFTSASGGSQVSTTTTMGAGNATIYAQWTETIISYTVTYNAKANGGSTDTQTKTVAYDVNVDLSLTATKSGWTFVGWNTNQNATTKLTSYKMPANNVTLYAIYSKVLTGSFKYYNNQTIDVTVPIYNTATSGTITAPAALGTPSGYTFRHWSTANTANAGKTWDASASVTLTANETYYASYQKTVTATFYYSAGTTNNYTDSMTQKSTTASATQYMNYVGTKVESNFTVPDVVSKSVGSAIAKTYMGVATATNSATVVTPTTANTAFYAVYYEGLTFYYYNGTAHVSTAVSRRMLSNGIKYVGSLDEDQPVPASYDGATFTSWQYQINADSSFTRYPLTTGVGKLYAKYTKSITATFNYHNGTAKASATASANRYYVSNESSNVTTFNTQITIPTVVKANITIGGVAYTYRGVRTDSKANASVLAESAVTTANTTYYASYSYTVTLTFDGNGSTGGTKPANVTGTAYMNYEGTKVGVELTMPANTFTKTGYSVDATNQWNSNTAGTGEGYKAGSKYTFTASKTIYSKWTTNSYDYKVTVNMNVVTTTTVTVTANGTSKPATKNGEVLTFSIPYGTKFTPAVKFTAQTGKHYNLVWGTDASATATTADKNVNGTAVTMGTSGATATVTLTELFTVTVTTNNASYGSVDKTSVANVPYGTKLTVNSNKVTINGTVVTATVTEATGYTTKFTGWTNGTATVTGALTVTANFTRTANPYKLNVYAYNNTVANESTFANATVGGTVKIASGTAGASASADVNFASTASITATASSGYTFAGWFKSLDDLKSGKNAVSTNATITTSTMTTSGLTYYAKFVVQTKQVTVTFNPSQSSVDYSGNTTSDYRVSDSGSSSQKTQTIKVKAGTNFAIKIKITTGYEIVSLTDNGTSKTISNGTYTIGAISANHTIVLTTQAITYHVIYHFAESGNTMTFPVTFGETFNVLTISKKTYALGEHIYTHTNWNTASALNGTAYADGASYKVTSASNINLYENAKAIWTINASKVTLGTSYDNSTYKQDFNKHEVLGMYVEHAVPVASAKPTASIEIVAPSTVESMTISGTTISYATVTIKAGWYNNANMFGNSTLSDNSVVKTLKLPENLEYVGQRWLKTMTITNMYWNKTIKTLANRSIIYTTPINNYYGVGSDAIATGSSVYMPSVRTITGYSLSFNNVSYVYLSGVNEISHLDNDGSGAGAIGSLGEIRPYECLSGTTYTGSRIENGKTLWFVNWKSTKTGSTSTWSTTGLKGVVHETFIGNWQEKSITITAGANGKTEYSVDNKTYTIVEAGKSVTVSQTANMKLYIRATANYGYYIGANAQNNIGNPTIVSGKTGEGTGNLTPYVANYSVPNNTTTKSVTTSFTKAHIWVSQTGTSSASGIGFGATSLSTAVGSATAGYYITILSADVTSADEFAITKNLHFNGSTSAKITFTHTGGDGIQVNAGTVTIEDITITSSTTRSIIRNHGVLTLTNATISITSNTSDCYTIINHKTLTVNGGAIKSEVGTALFDGSLGTNGTATATINNGANINAPTAISASNSGHTVTINSGTITGSISYDAGKIVLGYDSANKIKIGSAIFVTTLPVYVSGTSLNIDGTITLNASSKSANNYVVLTFENSSANVKSLTSKFTSAVTSYVVGQGTTSALARNGVLLGTYKLTTVINANSNITVSRTAGFYNGSTAFSITTAQSNQVIYYGDTLKVSQSDKTGYTVKYTITNNGASATSPVSVAGNVVVTATATAITYTITYDLVGGSVAKANPTTYTIETATFTLNNPAKTGYTFAGWTGSNGTTAQTTVTIAKGSTGNKSYKANWTINSYTLTIKPNGGVYGGKTTDTTITQDYNTTYTVANPTRTGYTFGGWDKTGEGTLTDTTFKFGAGNATLTAKWTINKSKLTIDPNGGSVKVGSETITESKTYEQNYNATLSIAVPTRTGYTFAGWEKSKTFNGELSSTTGAATYTFGATSGTTDRITATWETINYTITYNANGGNAVASMTYTIETNTFTLATTTRTGYVFAGWKVTAKSGSAMANKVAVTVGNIISQIDKGSYADITVEAQWTANSYKVAYNGNGATGGATATSEHTYDVVKELTSNGFVRNYTVTYNYNGATGNNTKANDVAKYTFAGWTGAEAGKYGTSKNAVTNNASGATLPNGAYVLNLATTGTVTLSAKWNAVSISLPQPTKAGYTFAGWYLDNKFTNKVENDYTPAADVTLYAKWTANEFIIDYENINANSVAQIENLASLPRKYTYGQSQTLVSATSKNYTFDGWYLDKAKTTKVGLQLTSEQTQVVGRITLYANWTYTIVFNTNAPAGTTVTGVANKGMNSGDSYAIAEKLTLNGYRFLGWKYGETTINVGDTVGDIKNATSKYHQISPTNSQVTLVAIWDKDERTVTVQYKVNGYTLNGKTIADYYGTSSNIDETPNVKPATGTIEWNSNQYVVKYKYAEKVQFNIVTDGKYNFTIKVDNVDVTKQVSNGTYTIDSLTESKSIVVEFTRKTFTVTITQKSPTTGTLHDLITKNNINYTPGVVRDENSKVVADGKKYTFVYGERLTYYFAVNSGYIIGTLKDNNTPVALNDDTYLISKLTSDHNLVIEYTEQDTWLSYATDGKLTEGHKGTSTDPYIIDSAEKLAELAKLVFTGNTFSGKYFIVKTDISLAHPASDVSKSPYWFPIGINESIHFAGNFNGDGYTVSDMEVLNGTSIGLFGYSAGTIYNVKVSGSVTGSEIVGGVVGTNAGTVNYAENNATLTGKIGSSRTILGGVVGYNTSNGQIHAAANAGAFGGSFYYAGGIAGKNGGSIYNAYNSGAITSSTRTQAFGGIVGYSTNGNIGYVYNYGGISNLNGSAGQLVGQIEGTETVNIKGYYLNVTSSATNSYDTGLDRSETQMKPASTYIFNTTSIYAGWNTSANNKYLDNIWEIRAGENNDYPVFKIQKNYKGEIVITSEYAKDTESFAMGFVKVTIGKKVYTFMLGKGKTYRLEGLEAGEYTVTTYASTNHTATAHRTNASGEVLGSVTLNETTTSVTIYIVIAKTGTGTFYGGAGIVGGSTSTNTTAMANEVEMVEYTEELDEKSEELESEVVQNNEETREEVEADTENDTQSNAEVVIPQPHFIATARIETKLNRVSKMEQISVKTKPSIPNSKTTMAENMAYMAEVKSTHIVPVHNKKTLV